MKLKSGNARLQQLKQSVIGVVRILHDPTSSGSAPPGVTKITTYSNRL